MPSIFDIVQSSSLASYWGQVRAMEVAPMTQELFPVDKQLGLTLKWIKGSRGLPIVLKPSAFDAQAIPRPRIGAQILQTDMPLFKESTYIDEELRQQLNMVLMTQNQTFIDTVVNRIFDDTVNLLRAAAARREQLRCMVLTTGGITVADNGQDFFFDYGMPAENKVTVGKSWSDPTADIAEDIRTAKESIVQKTGDVLTRAICDTATWKNMRNNDSIRKAIISFAYSGGTGILSDRVLTTFLSEELGLQVQVNDAMYRDSAGTTYPYIPANTFTMFPSGALGRTWFGTTPAESDLMSNPKVANVAIVDTGVSITTRQVIDPVQVETIVSQINLPSFERANSVYILNTQAAPASP